MEASLAFLLLACGLLLGLSSPTPVNTANKQDQSHETKATIEGLVRDIACPIQNPEATATHLSMKCLIACAKQGSPLVILTKDGELYFLISNQMPTRINVQGSCLSSGNTFVQRALCTREKERALS
jgi:hypothetical protein